MSTPAENIYSTAAAGNTAGTASTTSCVTTVSEQISRQEYHGSAGFAAPRADGPSAQQIDDLNFYLRRMTVGGNGDISQIESYGGGSNYEMFLDAVSSTGLRYGWSEVEMLRTVALKLKDKAREYYGALLPAERPKSMGEMKQWFRSVFGRKLTVQAGRRKLERCIRAPGEPLGEYAQRLRVIAKKIYPASTLTTSEKLYLRNVMLVNQFMEGLERRLANEISRVGEFYSLEECLEVAEGCEDIVSRMRPEEPYDVIRRVDVAASDQRVTNYASTNSHAPASQGPSSRQRGGPRKSRGYEGEAGRNFGNREGPTDYRSIFEKYPYMRKRCFNCGQEGHSRRGCLQTPVAFCFHCGKVGQPCHLNPSRPGNTYAAT